MGLTRNACAALAVAAAAMAAPAKADVLQIDGEGARWIAGDQAAAPQQDDAPASDESPLADERALADPAFNARLVPASYVATVQQLAQRFDLSPSLIEALVWQESRWRADAVSPKGARGLGQLMPGTARELGVDARDPHANLEGAARYLRAQLDRFRRRCGTRSRRLQRRTGPGGARPGCAAHRRNPPLRRGHHGPFVRSLTGVEVRCVSPLSLQP